MELICFKYGDSSRVLLLETSQDFLKKTQDLSLTFICYVTVCISWVTAGQLWTIYRLLCHGSISECFAISA